MAIFISSIVSAFNSNTIGTKVLHGNKFLHVLEHEISTHDFKADRVPGQGFIMAPELVPYLSCGIGKRTKNPDDYVARLYRGEVQLFLKREFAAPLENAAVVVYTTDAYLADPDVDASEAAKLKECGYAHVLVTILGFSGPQAPLPPKTFLHNLAGGNKEAELWSADEIRGKAKDVEAYWSAWSVVAD